MTDRQVATYPGQLHLAVEAPCRAVGAAWSQEEEAAPVAHRVHQVEAEAADLLPSVVVEAAALPPSEEVAVVVRPLLVLQEAPCPRAA